MTRLQWDGSQETLSLFKKTFKDVGLSPVGRVGAYRKLIVSTETGDIILKPGDFLVEIDFGAWKNLKDGYEK